jgi:hypothetical protein
MTTSRTGHLPASLKAAAETQAPAAGPVDEMTAARLRRDIETYFGDVPGVEHHLALLDARGAWYALRAMGAWDPAQPLTFFGLVRHVVRTMLPGPAPDPDVESWLEAGRPQVPDLAAAWDRIRACRTGHAELSATDALVRPTKVSDPVARMDAIVAAWPADLFDDFVLAYASVERILERRAEHPPLPPIE